MKQKEYIVRVFEAQAVQRSTAQYPCHFREDFETIYGIDHPHIKYLCNGTIDKYSSYARLKCRNNYNKTMHYLVCPMCLKSKKYDLKDIGLINTSKYARKDCRVDIEEDFALLKDFMLMRFNRMEHNKADQSLYLTKEKIETDEYIRNKTDSEFDEEE